MADGRIVSCLKAVRTYLLAQDRAAIGIDDVEIIPGAWTDRMTEKLITTQETVHLAFLGFRQTEHGAGGSDSSDAVFGAYVCVTGNEGEMLEGINKLEFVASALASCGMADDEGLGIAMAENPKVVNLENLYTKMASERGVAIYGLSFYCTVYLGKAAFDTDTEETETDMLHVGLVGDDSANLLDEIEDDERLPPLPDPDAPPEEPNDLMGPYEDEP